MPSIRIPVSLCHHDAETHGVTHKHRSLSCAGVHSLQTEWPRVRNQRLGLLRDRGGRRLVTEARVQPALSLRPLRSWMVRDTSTCGASHRCLQHPRSAQPYRLHSAYRTARAASEPLLGGQPMIVPLSWAATRGLGGQECRLTVLPIVWDCNHVPHLVAATPSGGSSHAHRLQRWPRPTRYGHAPCIAVTPHGLQSHALHTVVATPPRIGATTRAPPSWARAALSARASVALGVSSPWSLCVHGPSGPLWTGLQCEACARALGPGGGGRAGCAAWAPPTLQGPEGTARTPVRLYAGPGTHGLCGFSRALRTARCWPLQNLVAWSVP